jgi:hypothetical protein
MRDFDDSTLWRISAFERLRTQHGGLPREGAKTLLPSTLMSELQHLQFDTPGGGDPLEVIAACLRHHEAALLYLEHDGLVWPLTLFPLQRQYHAPRPLLPPAADLRDVKLLGVEPPGVRPPGHWMHERIAHGERYAPLPPLLWALALQGPRRELLSEIGGTAAYRATLSRADTPQLPGAFAPALQRLRTQSASLRTIASWPGMGLERASRLLNALYIVAGLVVTRTHPAARSEPGGWRGWFGGGRRG